MHVSKCGIYFTEQIMVTYEDKYFEDHTIHITLYRKLLLIQRKFIPYFSKIKSLKKRPDNLYFYSIEVQEPIESLNDDGERYLLTDENVFNVVLILNNYRLLILVCEKDSPLIINTLVCKICCHLVKYKQLTNLL